MIRSVAESGKGGKGRYDEVSETGSCIGACSWDGCLTPATALAVEPESAEVYIETLTEEGSEAYTVSDDESVYDGFDEPAAEDDAADDASFSEEVASDEGDASESEAEDPQEVEAEDIISEDITEEMTEENLLIPDAADDKDVLTEEPAEDESIPVQEAGENLTEEALGEDAVPELIPEVSEEVTSEPVREEALGGAVEDAMASGKYGLAPEPTPVGMDNTYKLDSKVIFAGLQNKIEMSGGTKPVTLKSYKIVASERYDRTNKTVATISSKGIITAKAPGKVLVVAYGADKKPVCCFELFVFFQSPDSASGIINKKVTSSSIFDYLVMVDPNGTPEKGSYADSFIESQFKFKSSNKKILTIDEKGKISTTGKSGSVTITISSSDKAKESCPDELIPSCKIKVKLKVKLASVKKTVKITPGKTATITVKNAYADNPVKGVVILPYDHIEKVDQSGKYNEKIKVRASADGGAATALIVMTNGELLISRLYSSQTKKRVYTDAGDSGTLGYYDTKAAKSLIRNINAFRKKNGAPSLSTDNWYAADVAMSARGANTTYTRSEFDSKADLLAVMIQTMDAYGLSKKTIGVSVFYDVNAKKYYLAFVVK